MTSKTGKGVKCNNIIVVSDLHCGDQTGLCPPDGVDLDRGGHYCPSTLQKKIYAYWEYLWKGWVPMVCRDEPYIVVCNGDAVEGNHHNSTHQISANPAVQERIALEVLSPIVKDALAYYHIRGTPAHGGESGCDEERLARALSAVPNAEGQYARDELWKLVGLGKPKDCALVHFCTILAPLAAVPTSPQQSTKNWLRVLLRQVDGVNVLQIALCVVIVTAIFRPLSQQPSMMQTLLERSRSLRRGGKVRRPSLTRSLVLDSLNHSLVQF